MFMQDVEFDEDSPRSMGKRPVREMEADVTSMHISSSKEKSKPSAHPNSVEELEDLDAYVERIADSGYGSRSSVIEQQKDIHKKKMQQRISGGVVRTSLPRQFSAPRKLDDDDFASKRFSRDDDDSDEYSRPVTPYKSSLRRGRRDQDRSEDHRKNLSDNSPDSDRERNQDRTYSKDRNRGDREGTRVESREKSSSHDTKRLTRTKDSDFDRRDRKDSRPSQRPSTRESHSSRRDEGNSVSQPSHNRSKPRKYSNSPSRSPSPSVSEEEKSLDEDRRSVNVTSNKAPSALAPKDKAIIDITDMKSFLLRPLQLSYDIVECYIERNKFGAYKMFPEYCLYLKEGDRFLLTAKKRPKNRTSNYLISMQRGDFSRRGSDNYLGKLRSNFLGTEFNIYDNGLNPKQADLESITCNPTAIRQELGIVMYAANVLGHRGPRKMKVCVPRVREDGNRAIWRPIEKEEEMTQKCKEQDHTNLTYLINKAPRWNDQVCAYVLNFNGRVTMASVKNFQLVTPEDQENVILQFGRVGKDSFTMDFRAPLCPLQAFAITLSSFDSKLACE